MHKIFDKRSKKGAMGGWAFAGIIGGVGTFLVLLMYFLFFTAPIPQETIEKKAEEKKAGAGQTVFCSNNPSVNLEARCEDILLTGSNGLNCTLALVDLDTGIITTQTIDTADAGTTRDTFTDAVTCGSNVEIGVIRTVDSINSNKNSFKKYTSTPEGAIDALKQQYTQRDPIKYDADTTEQSPVRVRVYDLNTRAYSYNGSVDTTADTDRTVFLPLAGGAINISSSTVNTSFDMDASDNLHLQIEVKTVTADEGFGELSGAWVDYLDTDSTADDFKKPVIKADNVEISDTKDGMPDQDKSANNGFDSFFNFGKQIRDNSLYIDYEQTPESGNDPDNDIIVRFVGSGIAVKSGTNNELLGRNQFTSYNTDISRTALVNAINQDMRISIVTD